MDNESIAMKKLMAVLGLALLCGCTSVTTNDFKVHTFLGKKNIQGLTYSHQGTNGATSISVEGYASNQDDAMLALIASLNKAIEAYLASKGIK